MAEDQDDAQKTEDPTQKRLQDALKRGQTANSREVSNFFIILAFTFIVVVILPHLLVDARSILMPFVTMGYDYDLDFNSVHLIASNLMLDIAVLVLLPFLVAIVAVFAASIVQNRFVFSVEPMKPKFEKISPIKGLKRLFSLRTVVEFVKSVFKISIVGAVGAIAVLPYLENFRLLPDESIPDILLFTLTITMRMLIGMCAIMFIIAALDFAYQKYEYIKSLRMTKQEVKDEYKQQEGDPMVKQRLRQIRMERARNRMMAAVPESDVVITNPTHYAIALKYDSMSMEAPVVSAKGQDKVAHRIRELAEANDIPIVRNPPLARILFSDAEVDEQIPFAQFQAVAEVISYVYKLKGVNPEEIKKQREQLNS